ncbi:MAG: hypothetical protein JW810_13280 [Sedimentisphaerales bacterium]|nr:hypothetical protein [Sedimentisphaerales bacterium]
MMVKASKRFFLPWMSFGLAMMAIVSTASLRAQPDQAAIDPQGSYVVVIRRQTHADPAWREVADTLRKKYDGRLVSFEQNVPEVLPELTRLFPRYACFVATPEETTREFVAAVHRLTRQLDEDPYTDVIWGMITGYTVQDALRIARHQEPLLVRRALTATVGAPLDAYEEGRMFNELKPDIMWEKTGDGCVTQKSCPTDTTTLLVEGLNQYRPDVFYTSGHATERDWMIGYGYRNGVFRCQDGQLYGQDTEKARHDVHSPNPKVFLGVGNCLIAHIPDRQCLALALMHSAGVYQMIGYTVPTGYGFGGWGVKDYFSELQAGRFTLAQAHYVNNLALVYCLEKRGQNDSDPGKRNRGGLRGDRDVVVLYGDPAWQARLPRRTLPWQQMLVERDGVYTFTITANQKGDWDNRPVVHLLPHRVKNIQVMEGAAYQPVITDNFILLDMTGELTPMKGNRAEMIPLRGDFENGQSFIVTFKAERMG